MSERSSSAERVARFRARQKEAQRPAWLDDGGVIRGWVEREASLIGLSGWDAEFVGLRLEVLMGREATVEELKGIPIGGRTSWKGGALLPEVKDDGRRVTVEALEEMRAAGVKGGWPPRQWQVKLLGMS